MARTDDDCWDVNEGVGATALGAAMVRAQESASDHPLVTDRYAQLFVDAAMARGWTLTYDDKAVSWAQEGDAETQRRVAALTDYAVCRTKWFDEIVIAAGEEGIRQFVILAAGLDARAWRLPWAHGTTVYEIDQPKVLQFKSETLNAQHENPGASYAAVPIDLRQDWMKALCENGFDSAESTAWTVEGLLPYLPPAAQARLLERIHQLSASGSRLAVDRFRMDADYLTKLDAHMQQLQEGAATVSGEPAPEPEGLFFEDEHTDAVAWLSEHGWRVAATEAGDLMAGYERELAPDLDYLVPAVFVEGRLTG